VPSSTAVQASDSRALRGSRPAVGGDLVWLRVARVPVQARDRLTPVFAELHLPSCTIAFGHTQTAQLFNNAARAADNHTVIIEFRVDDVDKE
jgi:hypothetical protein